jgi:hypothetical protein
VLNLARIATRIANDETIRLFREPGYPQDVDGILKELQQSAYEGRFFALTPGSVIGYHDAGQIIEVEVPIDDIALDNLGLIGDLFARSHNPDQSWWEENVKEAQEVGIPQTIIDQLVYNIDNYEQLIEQAEQEGKIIRTYDGVISHGMADIMEAAFKHVNKEKWASKKYDQVQMLRRGLKPGELVAVYEYDDNNVITEVFQINGTPTLKVGDKHPGLPSPN